MNPMLAAVLAALLAQCVQSIQVYPLKKKWDTSVCPKAHQKQLPDYVSAACREREYKVMGEMLYTADKDQPCHTLLSALFDSCHQSKTLYFLTPIPLDKGVKNEKCSGAMAIRAICVTANGTTLMAMGCKKDGTVDDVSRNPKWTALCEIHTYDKQEAGKEACIPMRPALPLSDVEMLSLCLLSAVLFTIMWWAWKKTCEPQTPIDGSKKDQEENPAKA